MNVRSILVHATLLTALLALAWFRADDKDAPAAASQDQQGEVVLEGDVTALAYRRDGKALDVEAQKDARGRWFKGRSRVPKPKPKEEPKPPTHPPDISTPEWEPPKPDPAPEPPKPEAPPEVEEKVFRANGEALWKRLEPFKVMRVIGPIDDARAKEYGLVESTGTLTLTIAGKPVEIAVGGKAFGTSDTYARLPDGRAVVLAGDLASKLVFERGPLFETKLFETPRPEIKSLLLQAAGKELSLVQHAPKERGQTFWAKAGSDTGDDEYLAWVNKLFRLIAQEYRPSPPPEATAERLKVTVTDAEGKSEKLTVLEGKDADGKPEYWVVSDYGRLASLVPRQVAHELVSDLAPLLPQE